MTKSKREQLFIAEIKSKCEQYWNEHGILDEEIHAALSFIWEHANAFNARVDEEVRKAVEEFRERVLHVVEGHICGPGCGVRGFGDSCSFDFPKAIRALPTEPERGEE